MQNAEILAVGSELLTPTKSDTNSLWLTEQLNALGVEVVAKSIVGDDRPRLAEAVRAAAARSDFLFITGGLGPTEDDVTRDAVAAALVLGQELREELLEQIAARFKRIGRPMAENNRRQAMLIEGAEAMENDRGTAPGQWLRSGRCQIALLPGPPREMKAMFELQVLPRLVPLVPPAVLRTRWYRVAGMGESDLDQLIAPVYTRYTNPVTTILASPGDVHVHLRARCAEESEAESLLAELGSQLEALLADRIYSTDGSSLEEVVGQLLTARGETVCVAESITGGGLGERLTRVPGASRYFRGGFLTYCDEAKQSLLGVSPELLTEHTAVSEPVAVAMAAGAQIRLNANWAISTTGYAGPATDTHVKALTKPGTVFVCIAGPPGAVVHRLEIGVDRDRVRHFTAIYALNYLRLLLG
ncbi:MAG: competence/damage-inducible protein A [Bryobacteraceae bacterium]|nr:competence/damage-inducible protein A [Bryobacteraceae bacterium]